MKLPNPNPKPQRSFQTNPNRKKRSHSSPQDRTRPTSTSDLKPQVNNKLVMGQVKILKRGEQLSETRPEAETVEKELSSTLPLTEKVDGLYAGYSMLVMSPPPSSVPLPAFITKKIAAVSEATSDLRKMLRLDFP